MTPSRRSGATKNSSFLTCSRRLQGGREHPETSPCQELEDRLLPEQFGISADGTVGRHLVVLAALGGANEPRVLYLRFGIVLERFRAFGEKTLHRLASLGLRFLAEGLERLFQPLDVTLGLAEVLFKGGLQLG